MDKLSLGFVLTADSSQLKAGLIDAQRAIETQQANLRSGLEKANQRLTEQKAAAAGAAQAVAQAEERARALNQALDAGPPTKQLLRELQGAEAAIVKAQEAATREAAALSAARDAALKKAAALREAKAAALENQAAIAAAARAEVEAAAIAKAAADASHRQQLANLQEEIRARREAAAEAAAQDGRQASAAALLAAARQRQARDEFMARNASAAQDNGGEAGPVSASRRGLESISTTLGRLQGIAAAAAGAGGLGAVILGLARIADEAQSVNARIRLASGSIAEFNDNAAAIRATANAAGTAVSDTAALFNRIVQPLRDIDGAAGDARQVVADVANTLRISGAGAAESASTLLQFSQALGAGVLRGEELNAILENSPRLARALADGLGVTVGELKRMGEAGDLTSRQVLKALQSQSETLAAEAARLPRTIGQASMAVSDSFKRLVFDADQATGASRLVAGGLDALASHLSGIAVLAAPVATFFSVAAVQAAVASVSVRAFAVAAGGALAAVGPIGWALTALSLGAAAWGAFSAKSSAGAEVVAQSLTKATQNFEEFASRMGDQERAAAIASLWNKVAEAQDRLADPKFRRSEAGKQLQAEAEAAAKAIEKVEAAAKAAQTALSNRAKERGTFGLDEKSLSGQGFIDKDMSDKLRAFGTLYTDFVDKRLGDNKRLTASSADVREALSGLFAQAKSAADFAAIQAQLERAIADKPLANRASFVSALENAIDQKAAADQKELEALTAGLSARLERVADFTRSAADQALLRVSSLNAVARVAAALKDDMVATARVDRAQAQADMASAESQAQVRLAAIEQVRAREVALIKERMTATQDQVTQEINGTEATKKARLDALRVREVELISLEQHGAVSQDAFRQEIARISDERRSVLDLGNARQEAAQKAARAEEARGRAGVEASESIARADGEAAIKRRAVLEDLQNAYKQKFQEALQAYQAYAQQVISLDQKIANNRLNTAASINALRRQNMTPVEQGQSLEKELAQIRDETDRARRAGQQDRALELLQRQQGLANQIGSLRGEGIDQKTQIDKGASELERIGAEADAIMQKQKAAAEQAAAAAKKQAEESAQAMNNLAEQITKLNERAEILLKPQIDQTALSAAVQSVMAAFENLTVPVTVVPTGLPAGVSVPNPGTTPDLPARAYGGPLPGHAPHDRADNMVYLGTPGEWVMQLPAVRYYGANFMAMVNAMKLPRHAYGGQLGGSLVSRLTIPSAPAAARPAERTPMNLHFPGMGTYPVQAAPDVAAELQRAFSREALKRGRRG